MEQEQKRNIRVRKNEKLINGDVYMTACKAAETLGVSRACINYYARSEQLRSLSMGKARYFKPEWITKFVEARTTK